MTDGQLDLLISMMDADGATRVRGWLSDSRGLNVRRLSAGSERTADTMPRPRADDPQAVRHIGIIGGGTAGYLTALALRAKRPWLEVTLVESTSIPIIGVGESTTPAMVSFLHHYLGIDPHELYQKVRPTWKQGIRFEWGPDPDGFQAPFDWDTNSIGIRGSLAAQGDINASSVQALLMKAGRTPVFDLGDGEYLSLMKYLPFAYHLDNARFVAYLTELALANGVRHIDSRIAEVVRSADDWVDHLRMADGRTLNFDMYVDCTGFPSVLLGKGLGTPYRSFADSLFTDSAVTGNVDHGGHLNPFTTAKTMDAGWCWSIPTRESNHLGYVYSSAALSDETAADELARRFPGVSEPRQVRFRTGRHEQIWRGNVMGVGNSYAFVEPLESSGLLMITWAIMALVSTLPASWADPQPQALVNTAMADRWDAIRWFLAVHYRFNTRLDTPFWKDVRERTDISGLQPLLDVYAAGAPLRFRDKLTLSFANGSAPTFYGIAGIDTILLGQKVPARLVPPAEPLEHWRRRKAGAEALVRHALPHADALAAFDTEPRLLNELLEDSDSWARPGLAFG
ncbi:tryptophan halogenase family protein [Micromonospora profundi]|uniref:tryptophan halogenase family protein n=1 Tax=Micromonospora TaxID=1873 RepID=UPI0014386F20|nr:tryptophan halogenase family protein [Micromonospora profundi]NJC12934.1 tryptophan halogenase [Micromonospora profundi]